MTKYEYKTVVLNASVADLETELNKIGSDGWKLKRIFVNYRAGIPFLYIFMREKQEVL